MRWFSIFILGMILPFLGWAKSPEQFFQSCLKDPVMQEFQELKLTEEKQADAVKSSTAIPRVHVQTILAPIQGAKGGVTAYTPDSWGPYWSFKAQVVWAFFYFGAEGLVREARDQFDVWLKFSKNQKMNLLLQTLTEGYIQKGFLYVVRRDLRKFLRHVKSDTEPSGAGANISAKEVIYANMKQLDLEMEKAERSLGWVLSDLCPSKKSMFEDPPGFWSNFYDQWEKIMLSRIQHQWPEKSLFVSQSAEISEHMAELKALWGEEAVISRPRLFVAGLFDTAIAPTRQPAGNPYVYDPYNQTTVGAGVGLDWNFDLYPIRTGQLKATLLKEKIFLTTQMEYKKYFELSSTKESLSSRRSEMMHNKERLDAAMKDLKWHAKEDTLDTLNEDSLKHFSEFYKSLHEMAIRYYKDVVELYFVTLPTP